MSKSIKLAEDVVDVWETCLDPDAEELGDITDILTPDEIRRADRFVDTRGRLQYLVSRALQRRILARYVGTTPAKVRFATLRFGKPILVASNNPGIAFNTSHSGNLTVMAVSRREVGIDLEKFRPIPRALAVARRFFTPEEHESLSALPEDQRARAFLSIWVKREGNAKARGLSVWRGLAHLEHSEDTLKLALPSLRGGWSTQFLDLGEDYVGAVIAAGTGWRVVRRGAE